MTSTDSVVTHVPAPEPVDIPAAVAGLRKTFASGRTRSVHWRQNQLRAIERMLTENETAIAEALAEDLGRQPFEAWLADVATTAAEAAFAAKHVKKWMKRRYRLLELAQLPGLGWVQYEPYGTVLIIGAWNFPFYLTIGPLIGAFAAGNTAVLKPSEIAPASSRLMAELVPRYLDASAVVVIEGDGATSQELLAQGFDRVLFTGGTEIGKKILAGAAPHLTPVTLELGGKNPVIIAADADLDVAAKRIAFTKLLNSGQMCIAPDYILADSSVRDELVAKLRDVLTSFREGSTPGMRIVNRRQFDRLTGYLAQTKGTVVHGGGSDASLLGIEPTIVVDPDPDEPLMQDEVFGPILPVLSIENVDAAIAFANARPKPLSAYLFTRSRDVREKVIAEVSSGGMLINHLAFQATSAKLPFGGVGASGMGAYHGEFGFEEFSHRKSVMTKPTRPDLSSLVYPPYTEKAWKLARKVF